MSKDKDDIAIKVSGVSKSFKLPHEKNSSIKSFVTNPFRRNSYEKQEVLKHINFEINKGEFFGIVGRNGSGKSTLLKLMAGIYSPDTGHIQINGKLTPFIELGVGFSPELTGRENVFLNGALLGFNRKEMSAMYEEIVEFAELEKFMDQKLKNYSSGMQVRLAFSIAIRAESDILVLDEVLAVGDEAFQRKCFDHFAMLKRNEKTVILVTHSMESVQRFCTRAMLINDGKIVEFGNPATVARKYIELNSQDVVDGQLNKNNVSTMNNTNISSEVKLKNTNKNLKFEIDISTKIQLDDVVITLMLKRDTGEAVYRWASDDFEDQTSVIKKDSTTKLQLGLDNIFPDGVYDLQLAVKSYDRSTTYALFDQIATFRLLNLNPDFIRSGAYWRPNTTYTIENNLD